MQKKDFILIFIIVAIFFFYQQNNKTHHIDKIIPASVSSLSNDEKYNFYSDGYTKLNITPLEKYALTAMVVSKQHYTERWNAKIAPYDLALIWGRLMDPDCLKTVSYSQGDRWYYYQYTADFPMDKQYITSHSSNNHIIPASDAILDELDKINVGQMIYLEGYLVNIDGKDGDRNVGWHSSLTREDSGDGSCELFYVNKISVNGITYT